MGTEEEQRIIRVALEKDLAGIFQLDQCTFVDKWSETTWRQELNSTLGYYLVLEEDKAVVGFAGFWLVAGEAQVTKVAVAKLLRGQGLGKLLTGELVHKAQQLGATGINLEVRAGNMSAQRVYTHTGFKVVGVRPHYYLDNKEDAVIMARNFDR